MKTVAIILIGFLSAATPAFAADDSRVKQETRQVEEGTKKIGKGQVGEGTTQTAKGIGGTVVEGAKYTGEKFKESGKAAEPEARSAWQHTRDGAVAFGHSVRNFFTRLFSD
jgi:hypothetical protein